MSQPSHAGQRWTLAIIFFVLILALFLFARQFVQADGRINQIAHFGGDAFYCVDGAMNPTTQLPTTDPGGFRLLDKTGQELWYVPGHDVEAALNRMVVGGDWELIAQGNGTYGPVSLHIYNTGGTNGIFYVFTGYDEHGKTNSLTFQSCIVGPAVGAPKPSTPKETSESTSEVSPTATGSATNTPTPTYTGSPTDTPTNTQTSTATDTPTDTPTSTQTGTATDTPTNTQTSTATDTPTDTPTSTQTSTATDTPTNTPPPS